ncbi:hypothetical protein [Winogradskyella sp.]|uniref:hypothetical protein n=1 Tax=Winogradskyella sp. TaxID=1883156 RepID=UPI003F6B4081
MKLLKKASYALLFTVFISTTYQCASTQTAIAFQDEIPFNVKPVSFQEWYAGTKVGGTGINIFVPISDKAKNVSIENIFFRNLQGRLTKQNGKYIAILKNPSKNYAFGIPEKPENYPFTLGINECVISYTEQGVIKYYKINEITEFAGTYYENGPPSIYVRQSASGLATLDEENDE